MRYVVWDRARSFRATVHRWLPLATVLVGAPVLHAAGRRSGSEPVGLASLRSILVIRLDEAGDVVMTSPFLRELRHNTPRARITLVVKPQVRELVERCPYVDEVLTYDPAARGELRRHWNALGLARRHLWRRRYDLAVVPRWDTDYYHAAYLAYMSGALRRVGYSERVTRGKTTGNRDFDRLFTRVFCTTNVAHEVRRGLDLVEWLGGTVEREDLELWTGDDDEVFARHVLATLAVPPVVLVPGARASKRRWPVEWYASLAEWIVEDLGHPVVLVGGPGEEPLARAVRGRLHDRVIDTVGTAGLRQAAALIRRSRCYVGNDTGPMHLAAAAGVPVVEISCQPVGGDPAHSTSLERFGPWRVTRRVCQPESARRPCASGCESTEPHCILGVDVAQVKRAVLEVLSDGPGLSQLTRPETWRAYT